MKVWVNMVQNKTPFRVIPPDSGWANPARKTSRGRFGSRDVSPRRTSFLQERDGLRPGSVPSHFGFAIPSVNSLVKPCRSFRLTLHLKTKAYLFARNPRNRQGRNFVFFEKTGGTGFHRRLGFSAIKSALNE